MSNYFLVFVLECCESASTIRYCISRFSGVSIAGVARKDCRNTSQDQNSAGYWKNVPSPGFEPDTTSRSEPPKITITEQSHHIKPLGTVLLLRVDTNSSFQPHAHRIHISNNDGNGLRRWSDNHQILPYSHAACADVDEIRYSYLDTHLVRRCVASCYEHKFCYEHEFCSDHIDFHGDSNCHFNVNIYTASNCDGIGYSDAVKCCGRAGYGD